jgi:hypothetical protein
MHRRRPKSSTTRRPYAGRLTATYLCLVLALVIVVVVVQLSPKNATVQRYGPNIVGSLVGILITVVVVERLLSWQRQRDATPIRAVALRRIWYQLNGLTQLLLFAYKASSARGGPEPTALEPLLENWAREARLLDFRRPYGPDGPPRSWHQYAAEVLTRFEDGFRDVIDRYLGVLGPELPAAAEDVIDHPVFQVVKNGPAIERFDAANGIDLPRLSFDVRSVEDPTRDSLTDLASRIVKAHEAYDRLGGPPLTLDARLYDDAISPGWGSARFEGPFEPNISAGPTELRPGPTAET